MIPCNPCVNGNCGSCVAERLQTQGHIRDAKFHCGCAEHGHKNSLESKQTTKEIPKIKSMLGRQKEERDVPVDKKISVEEEVEIEVD